MFGNLFKRKEKDTEVDVALEVKAPEILGLRLGGSFELDTLNLKLIEPKIIFEGAADTHFIQAVGVVRLDADTTILRYYTDDDGFIQVMLSGGNNDEHVSDVKLFYFYETTGIATKTAWDNALENSIGKACYALEEHEFTPVWEDISEKVIPVHMTEKTTTENDKSETDQFGMLYERCVEDDLYEFVLVTGEEKFSNGPYEQPDRCLVIATGVNLTPGDIEIIG